MRVVKIDQGTEQIPDPQVELDQLQLEHPLVLVIWRDAFFDFDQSNADDIRPDYLVHTVGFLLAEGPKFVSLAQEVLPDGDGFRAVTHIPLSIVERIVRLGAGADEASPLALIRCTLRRSSGRSAPRSARRRDEQMNTTSASAFTSPRPSRIR